MLLFFWVGFTGPKSARRKVTKVRQCDVVACPPTRAEAASPCRRSGMALPPSKWVGRAECIVPTADLRAIAGSY
eukprot:gene23666-biopygen13388